MPFWLPVFQISNYPALSVVSNKKMSRCCFVADSCIYKKVCPFNGGSFLVQPCASDFQFCWNQAPYAIGKKTLDRFALPTPHPPHVDPSDLFGPVSANLLACCWTAMSYVSMRSAQSVLFLFQLFSFLFPLWDCCHPLCLPAGSMGAFEINEIPIFRTWVSFSIISFLGFAFLFLQFEREISSLKTLTDLEKPKAFRAVLTYFRARKPRVPETRVPCLPLKHQGVRGGASLLGCRIRSWASAW